MSNYAVPSMPAGERVSHVESQMERAAKLTSEAMALTESLEGRIRGILREPTPLPPLQGGTQAQAPPRPILVGHAMALSNGNDQLADLCARLQSMIDRIEL